MIFETQPPQSIPTVDQLKQAMLEGFKAEGLPQPTSLEVEEG